MANARCCVAYLVQHCDDIGFRRYSITMCTLVSINFANSIKSRCPCLRILDMISKAIDDMEYQRHEEVNMHIFRRANCREL